MDNLPLHAATEAQLAAFTRRPSHALLLTGQSGSGKRRLVRQTAATLLQVSSLEDYPYFRVITPTAGKAIGIEAVRELEQFLSLRVPRGGDIKRVVIIEDAHLLTQEAQNALLKTLEEPPAHTVILMTAGHPQALLPTIRSRTQTITLQSPERTALMQYFSGDYPAEAVQRAYAMSGGLPELMQALLVQADHPLLTAAETARELLKQPAYDRLLLADRLAKDRQLALDVVGLLQQMAHISLQTATGAAAKRWNSVLQAGYNAAEALLANAQPKLVLTRLALAL